MKRYSLIRDHLSLYWKIYLGVLAAGCLSAGGFLFRQLKIRHAMEVARWPEVTAVISSSNIGEHGYASDVAQGTYLSVDLRLVYFAEGRTMESKYVGSWTRATPANYHEILAQGRKVKIRYKPGDPSTVSLYPLILD